MAVRLKAFRWMAVRFEKIPAFELILFATHVDYQKSIPVIASYRGAFDRGWELYGLFETAVSDLHLVVYETFAVMRVFSTTTDGKD
jgi:hypothetical protein